MTAELVNYEPQNELRLQMDYARTVVQRPEHAAASLLPQAYKDNPANVLIAIGLGSAMGLSYAESLYRIDVIQGKPCAAAELIASNVRKAGHKLRIRVTEEPASATCTIIRSDDPDEPITITRDMAWAQRMGLTGKENYKKQPATMLGYRAITACARLACPEALYGVVYTADEMYDMEPAKVTATVVDPAASGADRMKAILTPQDDQAAQPVAVEETPATTQPVTTPPVNEPVVADDEGDVRKPTQKQFARMWATFGDLGIDEEGAHLFMADVVKRPITSGTELSYVEVARVIGALDAEKENATVQS